PCADAAFLQHADLQLHQSGVQHGPGHSSRRTDGRSRALLRLSAYYAYDLGATDTSVSFEKLRDLSKIHDKAALADAEPNFSARIRDGVPSPRRRRGGSGAGRGDEHRAHIRACY